MTRASLRHSLLLALLGALSACSILPAAEPLRAYLLPTSASPARAATQPQAMTLRIQTPHASRLLATPRIAVIPVGSQISSYRGARWSDAAPTLLRDRLIETFQGSGRVASVVSEDSGLQAERELASQLLAFQAEYVDGAPLVVVRLDAQLADGQTQRVLASRRFEVRQPSRDASLDEVVSAFGQASDALAGQLLDWILQQ
ncbi:ABC-type transport auxiliary lipoprotein family protein [Pseudomonas oligotrophica]|uniref:ABC-type transport auxiliary lipoprotein family protein n=1 Tax=Pseudomonas oligotrophica TaxID=2912055 RepID=UPI001F3C287C|nr:ABC-type transport auxiliary lipoprotein family protein [Pseudomonas oligotrophica]MCF7200510.1 ABC-type transport auxiliary lipoprotein family protein [Pseudomonas oligotrophica]